MGPDTLKNAKSAEEPKVGDSERRDETLTGSTDVKEGKNRLLGTEYYYYWETEKRT